MAAATSWKSSPQFRESLAEESQATGWEGDRRERTGHLPACGLTETTSSIWTAHTWPLATLQLLHWFWVIHGAQHAPRQGSFPFSALQPQHYGSLFQSCCAGSGKSAKAFSVNKHWASCRLMYFNFHASMCPPVRRHLGGKMFLFCL